MHAWGAGSSVPVVDRSDFAEGDRLAGPAIIEERETTIVIAPGWTAAAGPLGCIIATRDT